MQIFTKPNFNFIRWRWHAIVLSLVVIGAGLAYMVSQGGMPLGIDFKGGSILILKFDRAVSEDAVRKALEGMPGEKVVQQYGPADAHEILVRLPLTVQREEDAPLDQSVKTATEALQRANLGQFEASTEVVGPVIGAQLQRKGVLATLFSILGITVYIAFRFRFSFAVGAFVATFHDILVTLAFLAFFGYDLSLNVVAALLTITGYSVNDTIVIFDRVRENFRSMRRDSLEHIVNTSVNQTLGRTVITAGTTLLSVVALYLFGGEVLEAFAFTMIVGIISGTYSTVFIAAAIAIILSRQREQAKVPATAGSETPNGGARKSNSRKKSASQA